MIRFALLSVVLSALFSALLPGCGEEEEDGPKGARPAATRPETMPPEPAPQRAKSSVEDVSWIRDSKAEITLVVVGNQRGKLKPCGCSDPQMGGLERLGAFLDGLRTLRRNAEVRVLSMGWSMADRGEPQAETKAALYRRALDVLGFDVQLLGTTDLATPSMAQPFDSGHALDRPAPPANTMLKRRGPLAQAAHSSPIIDLEIGDLDVRALSLLDPAHFGRLGGLAEGVYPPDGAMGRLPPRKDALWLVSTDATGDSIERVRAAMRRLGPSLIIDFERGSGLDVVEKRALEQEPLVVSLSRFGKDVGVVDLVRDEGGAWRLSWHVVALYPGIGPKESASRDAIRALFDRYRREVKTRGYLATFPTYPEPAHRRYVGSARCVACHEAIYEDWAATAHATALGTLEARDHHWDPECVRCHVVGFQRMNDGRWSRAASGFVDPERTPYLAGVGCESCHGPGAAHLEDPTDDAVFATGGPMTARPSRQVCEVCHDVENSHAFPEHYADEYLPKVDHREVPAARR